MLCLLSVSESHFGFSGSLFRAAHNSYRSLKIKAVVRTLEKQWKNRGAPGRTFFA